MSGLLAALFLAPFVGALVGVVWSQHDDIKHLREDVDRMRDRELERS